MQAVMGSLINATYVRQLAKMVHRSLGERARAGQSCGGSMYGYRTVPDPRDGEHKVWIIDTAEAAVVRRIFGEIEAGRGHRAICDGLNADGLAPPRSKSWFHQTIVEMVRNERYVGKVAWNRAKTTKVHGDDQSRHEERPEAEHIVRDAPELAILDRTTWDRVQRQLATRKRQRLPAARHGQLVSLASGLLACGACGASYTVRGRKLIRGKMNTAYAEYGTSVCAQRETISAARASEALVARLRELLDTRRTAARLDEAKPAHLEKQLAKAKKRASNATALLVEDPTDAEARQLR
jgi:hypothetical protein